DGFVDAAPASFTAKASAQWKFRGYRAASAPAAYASRVVLPPPLQSSLPAGRLAFTGRELNPLDRCKRFQVHILIPLFWIYPDARRAFLHLSYSYAAPRPEKMMQRRMCEANIRSFGAAGALAEGAHWRSMFLWGARCSSSS